MTEKNDYICLLNTFPIEETLRSNDLERGNPDLVVGNFGTSKQTIIKQLHVENVMRRKCD